MCSVTGCSKPGKWSVGFKAFALGQAKIDRNAVKGHFNIVVCDSHKEKLGPSDLINGRGWEDIQQRLLSGGLALLDRQSLVLVYDKAA